MIDITTSTANLDSDISERIRMLCHKGYQHFDQGDTKIALRQFYSAWTLLPKPQSQWEEAGWVLTALGDAYFSKGEYETAKESLVSALHCPKGLDNPIIHMRLGQCLYELDAFEEAKEQLHRSLAVGGQIRLEKEHPKYLKLLESSNP